MFDPSKYNPPKMSKWERFYRSLDEADQVYLEGLRSMVATAKAEGQPEEEIAKKQNLVNNLIKALKEKYNK